MHMVIQTPEKSPTSKLRRRAEPLNSGEKPNLYIYFKTLNGLRVTVKLKCVRAGPVFGLFGPISINYLPTGPSLLEL